MPIHDPPWYLYPWFQPWSKLAFEQIHNLARSKKYPEVQGTKEEKNAYLIMLIRTQKALHGWQKPLLETLEQIQKTGSVNTKTLIKKYPSSIVTTKRPAWVTYEEDRTVSDFIDELGHRNIQFVGSDREMGEFILRFILGQLGHGWEGTILMIWEMIGSGNTLYLKDLNKEMRTFDYLKLFS